MIAEERNARASRLRELLEHQDVKDAIASIESDLTKAWRACHDTQERENLWRSQHILGLLTQRLATWTNADIVAIRRMK
jgi:hypothetical protein